MALQVRYFATQTLGPDCKLPNNLRNLGTVAHTCNSVLGGQRQVGLCEFWANLLSVATCRPPEAIYKTLCLEEDGGGKDGEEGREEGRDGGRKRKQHNC